ncbi:MAG: hypothetical protein AABZ85_04150, partial [Thermodesulfobacteriota bacterium]
MRRAAFAALAALSGCAEIGLEPAGVPPPPPPRPFLREARAASANFGAGLIAHRKVDGLRLEVLTVGEGQVPGSYLSELKSPASRLKPPALVFLIKHPKEGSILFGAGLPEDLGGLGRKRVKGAPLAPFKVTPGADIIAQLEKRGVMAKDGKWIILPDLAPEWAGRAGSFPNATVVVSAQAWTNPKRKYLEAELPDPRAFVPEERLRLQDFTDQAPYGPFAHGQDFLMDGTLIL